MSRRRPYIPSPTLLLHLFVILLGVLVAEGQARKAPVVPARMVRPADDLRREANAPVRVAAGPVAARSRAQSRA